VNAQEAADILGGSRRRHGDLREMLRALRLYPWLNTAEDEKRREAARWALTGSPLSNRHEFVITISCVATRAQRSRAPFKSTWGPLTIASDATFVAQAYTNVFGAPGTAAQNQHFVDQMNFYKSIYTASGAFGTDANLIDLLARGAIYGQMLGVKAESPTAALAAASAPADISLVGVSAQDDITHSFS